MALLSDFVIRHAETRDALPISSLLTQLGYPVLPADVATHIEEFGNNERDTTFVIEVAGVARGFLALSINWPVHLRAGCCVVHELVIDEQDRSNGLGMALLKHAELYALNHGCVRMQLVSGERRERAHAFYERHGYREERKRFIKEIVAR